MMASRRRHRSDELRRVAGEQAALRRVATLVAGGAMPEQVFAAVTAEAGRLLDADFTGMSRYDPDGESTVLAQWVRTGAATYLPVGTRVSLGGRNVRTLVFQTGQPVRIDDYAETSGPAGGRGREWGLRAAVGVPVSVEGRLWGVMSAGSRHESLPVSAEARLVGFTELAATAIANAQARIELRGYAEEQAALRRVATLVARAAPPEEVFAAVTAEAGRVLAADVAVMARYDADGTETFVGTWTGPGADLPVGIRLSLGGRNVASLVFQTGRAARLDDYSDASGPAAGLARELGLHSTVGVPISVEGMLWGAMIVGSRQEPLLASTEARLAGFTEMAATAIASAQARMELRRFAEEQAALRRVATLVARGAPPEEVFAAVTAEAGRALSADLARMCRYDPDSAHIVVGAWTRSAALPAAPVGTRVKPGGRNVASLVLKTGRPARIDDYTAASGSGADFAREWGLHASVGAPVSVEGRLWGYILVGSTRAEPLPTGTEARLAGFTELVATAIANAEAQTVVTASRARIVAAADAARRRIERDLHDGAQQRLVSLGLRLRAAQEAAPEAGELAQQLEGAVTEVTGVLEEVHEIARGLHPSVLTDGGLRPALRALARRSAVPVDLYVQVVGRLPEPVEIAAYYAVSEALTNAAKHARASVAEVEVAAGDGLMRVSVRDDGRGGADFGHGSGLVGLRDRVEALSGRVELQSQPGAGTTLRVVLPLTNALGSPPADKARQVELGIHLPCPLMCRDVLGEREGHVVAAEAERVDERRHRHAGFALA